jgi:hypothetical protein
MGEDRIIELQLIYCLKGTINEVRKEYFDL